MNRSTLFPSRSLPVQAPASAAAGPGLQMLIADDNQDAADSLALLLGLKGHSVHIVHDGQQALALARRIRPQVAILDIGMPLMDGHRVARGIRESLPGMLIIALTGRREPGDLLLSKAAGFDHHFTKPVALDELLDCIERWRRRGGSPTILTGE